MMLMALAKCMAKRIGQNLSDANLMLQIRFHATYGLVILNIHFGHYIQIKESNIHNFDDALAKL